MVYQDLLGAMDGSAMRNRFHAYTLGNVLHQMVDRDNGDENITKVFKFGSEIVKPNGLIWMQDVGQAAYLQFPVIPANLVDREGCVPGNIYERVSFESVAVDVGKDGYKKLAYPLRRLRKLGPEGLQGDAGIYESQIYVVLEVSDEDILRLDACRSSGDFDGCDGIIEAYVNVNELQAEVSRRALMLVK